MQRPSLPAAPPPRRHRPLVPAGFCSAAFGQRPFKVTGSHGVAPNNNIMLSSNQIPTVINELVEVVNTLSEDIQYVQVPVAATPRSRLHDFFEPIGVRVRSVARRQRHHAARRLGLAFLLKYRAASLLDAHTRAKSCLPIIQPYNGFWEQSIHYESQPFGENTAPTVNSRHGCDS